MSQEPQNQNQATTPRQRNRLLETLLSHWKQLGFGMLIGGIVIWLSFRPFYCFYTYQFEGARLITWIVTSLAGLFFKELKRIRIMLLKQAAYFFVGAAIITSGFMLYTTFFQKLDKNYCVADFDRLVALIEKEGSAVIQKDMSMIQAIYSPTAIIARADTGEFWQAYTYYSQKFVHEDHCTVSHLDYQVVNFSPTEVKMTTSSMGTFGLAGQGCTISYANPPGSDEWIFQKIDRAWKIVHLEFNKNK